MTIGMVAKRGRLWIGRLERGECLREALTAFCRENKIASAQLSAVGSVERAHVGWYDPGTHQMHQTELYGPHEIVGFGGNVSVRDGAVVVHAHIMLSDKKGNAFGGHLLDGTTVFACEFSIEEFEGVTLIRHHDEETGLSLLHFPEIPEA